MCKEIAILSFDGTVDYVCTKAELERTLGRHIPSLRDSPDNGCLCPLDESEVEQVTGGKLTVGWDTPYHCDLVMTTTVEVGPAYDQT